MASFSEKVQAEFDSINHLKGGGSMECGCFHRLSSYNFHFKERRKFSGGNIAKRRSGMIVRRATDDARTARNKCKDVFYSFAFRNCSKLLRGFRKNLLLPAKAALLLIAEKHAHGIYDRRSSACTEIHFSADGRILDMTAAPGSHNSDGIPSACMHPAWIFSTPSIRKGARLFRTMQHVSDQIRTNSAEKIHLILKDPVNGKEIRCTLGMKEVLGIKRRIVQENCAIPLAMCMGSLFRDDEDDCDDALAWLGMFPDEMLRAIMPQPWKPSSMWASDNLSV
jgi:hypothetical protein